MKTYEIKIVTFLSTLFCCISFFVGWDKDGSYFQQAFLILGGMSMCVVLAILKAELP